MCATARRTPLGLASRTRTISRRHSVLRESDTCNDCVEVKRSPISPKSGKIYKFRRAVAGAGVSVVGRRVAEGSASGRGRGSARRSSIELADRNESCVGAERVLDDYMTQGGERPATKTEDRDRTYAPVSLRRMEMRLMHY